ncbi:MAG TPA: M48 family metallopeptidase [Thermoanaerobaculia bacterium]|nr:M48 family metallopeptidase [Thermoanaerobaculia bacterium]
MKPVRSLSVVVALLFLASCGSSGAIGGGSISLDQEWQLGNQMAAQIAQQVHIVNDPQADALLRKIGEQLHAQTPNAVATRPFEFEIVDDPTVNAFSIPGGHVYVNSGLIGTAGKADELAAVLAHEISHITARHVIKEAEKQQQISVLSSIVLGQNAGALQTLVTQVLAGGAMARFSRADEKEADDMGLDLMTKARFDPHGMLDFFQRLLDLQKGGNSAAARFFADHPGTQDRIDDINGRISKMAKTSGIVDEPDFQAIRTHFPNAAH